MRRATAVTAIWAALAGGVFAQPAPGLRLRGPDGRAATLSPSQIAALPHVVLHVVQHGQAHAFAGPLAADLLAGVGAPLGAALRGPALDEVVVATGRDGYAAALSLAECDPSMRPGARVIVADQEDGHALDPAEGPLRLVVEGDARPARAVRMLASLDVTTPGAARTNPTQP